MKEIPEGVLINPRSNASAAARLLLQSRASATVCSVVSGEGSVLDSGGVSNRPTSFRSRLSCSAERFADRAAPEL